MSSFSPHEANPHTPTDPDERHLALGCALYDGHTTPRPLRGPLWEALHAASPRDIASSRRLTQTWRDKLKRPSGGALAAALHPRWMTIDAQRARRSAGAFYTPAPTARWLASETMRGLTPARGAWRVADPCCGCGAFLLAALDVAGDDEIEVMGLDLDVVAVEIARWRVWRRMGERDADATKIAAMIQPGDGLTTSLQTLGALDVVLSNPPFGNAIEAETSRDEATRAQHAALMPTVARGAYDLSALFAARAVERLRPGGRYGLVMPRSTLSLHSAAGMRAFLERHAHPQRLWAPQDARIFQGADVFVALMTGQRTSPAEAPSTHTLQVSTAPLNEAGGPAGAWETINVRPGPTWALWTSSARALWERVARGLEDPDTLADLWHIHGGAATGAAYELRPQVCDDVNGKGPRLITTGLIDRYTSHWGARTCRYLKGRFEHPRWPAADTPEVPRSVTRAMARQRSPKVLVAGLSRALEAVADPDGVLAGVVSTWVVHPRQPTRARLALLEALLNAPVLSLAYMVRFQGKEMSGGNTTIGSRELGSLPVPADWLTLLDALDEDGPLTPPSPARPSQVWTLPPSARKTLVRWAAWAAQHPAGVALSPERDAMAAACLSALYGLDLNTHTAMLTWYEGRTGIALDSGALPIMEEE